MMMMDALDAVLGGCNNVELAQQIIKGKRTKRPRPLSPMRLPVTACSSCTGSGSGGTGGGDHARIDFDTNNNLSSPSSSIEFACGEEEDMANCLILLAQGSRQLSDPEAIASTTTPTASSIKAMASSSGYVYQCKTCNRCFSSFQALGGHRASHKKPNITTKGKDKDKNKGFEEEEEEEDQDHQLSAGMNTTLSLQIANRVSSYGANGSTSSSSANIITKSNKVHECSICGAEFSSGQALGGHMRRHRAAFTKTSTPQPPTATAVSLVTKNNPESQESKKPRRSSLLLDLNLPAPEEDHRESKFHFTSNKDQVLVFSASPLVDCHY